MHTTTTKPRGRTTVPLRTSARKLPVNLSFEADLALQYAIVWLHRAGRLKVPAAGVIRRALIVYANHLGTANEAAEFRAAHSACTALSVLEEDQQGPLLRLYGADEALPLPPYAVIARGPHAAREAAELEQRVEANVRSCRLIRRKVAA